jgi:hypothetical protein
VTVLLLREFPWWRASAGRWPPNEDGRPRSRTRTDPTGRCAQNFTSEGSTVVDTMSDDTVTPRVAEDQGAVRAGHKVT